MLDKYSTVTMKITILYLLVKTIGNKYYADIERLNIIQDFCKICKVDYIMHYNHIEIFIITKLNYIENRYFEGKMIYPFRNYKRKIITKVGKYVLFI